MERRAFPCQQQNGSHVTDEITEDFGKRGTNLPPIIVTKKVRILINFPGSKPQHYVSSLNSRKSRCWMQEKPTETEVSIRESYLEASHYVLPGGPLPGGSSAQKPLATRDSGTYKGRRNLHTPTLWLADKVLRRQRQ